MSQFLATAMAAFNGIPVSLSHNEICGWILMNFCDRMFFALPKVLQNGVPLIFDRILHIEAFFQGRCSRVAFHIVQEFGALPRLGHGHNCEGGKGFTSGLM